VVCEDVQKDSTISLYLRELAQEKGFRGGIALPLRNENKTFGMLVIFSNAIFKKGNDEIRLLQELADNLAFGIVNLRSQQERQLVLSAVHAIAEGVSASTGKEFFEKLALNMTEALGAQVGIISCLQEGEPLTSRTIVVVMDGKVVENFDIPITGTPCENLSHAEEVIEVIDVAKRYPFAKTLSALGAEAYIGRRIDSSLGQPLGQVFVLYRQPLDRTGFVSAVLKIFAARIAAELERQN
jgi:GAF domain-containing protein